MENENVEKIEEQEESEPIFARFYLKSGALIEIELSGLEILEYDNGNLAAISWTTKAGNPALRFLRVEDVVAVVTVPQTKMQWN